MSAAPDLGVRRIARLSGRVFDEALTAVSAEFGSNPALDLRADAYGHGALELAVRLRSQGFDNLVHDRDAAALDNASTRLFGFDRSTEPLLSLEGEVVAVKRVAADTAVSYGYTYRTTEQATLALVGLGYADGVPRCASNRATVRIGDRRGVIAGRIAMDQLVVDLGDASAEVGQPAVLWDDAETLAEWCHATERSAAALTTRLGRRITRVWSEQ